MCKSMSRKILVTSALPYANGPLHLGHMVEYIQTDVWVRTQKMNGHECYYICADDAHGTAIMLKAKDLNITPEQLIEEVKQSHERDFAAFDIEFDQYHSTHSEENRYYSESLYLATQKAGCIISESIEQAYDEQEKLFLPDRYIKGTCPKCQTADQYGDNCENCGATYDSNELIDPVSVISGTKPVFRPSLHYFFDLPQFETFLKKWTTDGVLRAEMSNKLNEWFDAGLKKWDITRDAPYFGFTIPGTDGKKYFYVWLDAPVGYMASFKHFCDKNGMDFDAWWQADSQTELHHFIGKDIVNFHALFWPAILKATGHRLPTKIHTHGFLTINGQKMSKSRGTFIKAETYLKQFRSDYLRYYFASKLSGKFEDLDLNLDDFMQKINSDIIGKFVNIASRSAKFITKYNEGKLLPAHETALMQTFINEKPAILQSYEQCDTADVIRRIMKLADLANQYIDQHKPWAMLKDPKLALQLHQTTSQAIHCFYLLVIYLKPVLPQLSKDAETFLNCHNLSFADIDKPLAEGHVINIFKPLAARIEPNTLSQLMNASTAEAAPIVETNEITIDEFDKCDFRVAEVLDAQNIEGSNKLIQLTLSVGELGQKTVFSGIQKHYQAKDLIGRHVMYVANLKPRKMKFGISEGMVLSAADSNDNDLWILTPDQQKSGVAAGLKIQ